MAQSARVIADPTPAPRTYPVASDTVSVYEMLEKRKIIFGNPRGADFELTIRNIPLHAGIESTTAPQVDTAPALIYAYAL